MFTGLGPAYLFGDVGGNKDRSKLLAKTDFIVADTKYMFSLSYRHIFKNNLGLKGNVLFGSFEGSDANSRNAHRDFDFKSNLMIFSANAEYNLIGGEYAYTGTKHKLYLVGGLGLLVAKVDFNTPNQARTTDTHGKNAQITPVGDGYNVKKTTIVPAIPIGGGYEYELSKSFYIGMQYIVNATFSDYLDGVSTKDSKRSDYLMNLDFTFTYKIGSSRQNRSRVSWN
jgi:hypothetical protein